MAGRFRFVVFLVLAVLATAGQSRAAAPAADLVAQGAYLARAADCVACHTAEGGIPYSGGRAFKLPFGTLYAPNITPDKDTGIGNWSDDEFVRAMQKGVGKGGKHLYPAFPYTSYTLMPRDDILAIKAYLFILAPVRARAPDNSLMFPFNQRWLMAFWSILFNSDERFQPDSTKPPEWNRGAYLVKGPGHCGECHTPRNLLQARKSSRALAGAVTAGWKAYNITPDRDTGIGGWADDALATYLSTGHAEGHGTAAGPMAEAVSLSLRYLTPQDIRAIVAYLKVEPAKRDESVPPVAAARPAGPALAGGSTRAALGAHVFAQACVSCHRWDGSGAQTPYATLTGSRTVNDPGGTNLMQVVLHGSSLDSPQGRVFMPGFARGYSDLELAEVVNYVTGRFGAEAANARPANMAKARSAE